MSSPPSSFNQAVSCTCDFSSLSQDIRPQLSSPQNSLCLLFRPFALTCVPVACSSASGQILATGELPEIPEIPQNLSSLHSFKGLSGTHYLNGSYKDDEVIRHGWLGHILYESDRCSFKCRVIRPIIHQPVRYRVFLRDNSTLVFTGGRNVTNNERHDINNTLSWEEEYEFDINYTTNMTRGECLGMDVYSKTWKVHQRDIGYTFAGGSAPRLQSLLPQNNGTLFFTLGEKYKLTCPVNLGTPWADITWIMPSGERILSTRREMRDMCVQAFHDSDKGHYTCVAKNKYGSVSYDFTVQLYHIPLLEYLAIRCKWFCFDVISWSTMILFAAGDFVF